MHYFYAITYYNAKADRMRLSSELGYFTVASIAIYHNEKWHRCEKIESQLFRKWKATFLGPAYRVENTISQENVYLYFFLLKSFIVILYWILPLMQHRNRKECEILFFFNQTYLAKKLGQTMDHVCAIESNAFTVHGIYQILQTQLFLVSLWSLEHRRSNCAHWYFLSNRIFSSRSPSLYAEYRRSQSIPMVHLFIFRMSWIKQLCHRSEWQLIT